MLWPVSFFKWTFHSGSAPWICLYWTKDCYSFVCALLLITSKALSSLFSVDVSLCNIIFKTASHSLIGKNNSTTGEEVIYIVCQIYWRMFLVWRDWRRNTCIFFSSFFAVPLCHQLDVTSSWWFNRKTQHNQTKDAPVILTCQWANISLRVQDWFCVNAASCSVGLVSSFWTIWISGVDCFFLQCLLMFLSFLEVFIGLFALINMSKWKRSSTNCWSVQIN